MKTLTLLRHAKSGWDDPVAARFRPAAQRARPRGGAGDGPRDARARPRLRSHPRLARRARDRDARRASPRAMAAARARLRRAHLSRLARRPCSTSSARPTTRCDGLLLVGHNPGLEQLALLLTPRRRRAARRGRAPNIRPATLAEIELAGRPLARRRRRAAGTLHALHPAARPRSGAWARTLDGDLVRSSPERVGERRGVSLAARRPACADRAQLLDGTRVLVGRRRRGGGDRRSASRSPPSPLAQQLLDAADRIAVLVEQAVDALGQRDVVGPVIAAVAGALQRPQLREARLPIAQDMLRDAEVGGKLADRPEGAGRSCGSARPCRAQPPLAIRSRMI